MAYETDVIPTTSDVEDNATSSEYDPTDVVGCFFSDDLTTILWRWIWPPLCVTGLLGNTLVLLVLRRDGLVRTSANVYLCVLAVADNLVLVVASVGVYPFCAWGLRFEDLNTWTCRTILPLSHTLSNTSIWIIAAFTAERCVVVCFPLLKLRLCTPRTAGFCCVSLSALALVKNSDLFFISILAKDYLGNDVCTTPSRYLGYVNDYRPWINLVATTAVPLGVVLVCNWAILEQLRWTLMRTAVSGSTTRITFMCLGVSFAFIACVVPGNVFVVIERYWPMTPPTRCALIRGAMLLRYVNHAINFFLYNLTGSHFRRELVALFRSARLLKAKGIRSIPSRVTSMFSFRWGFQDD